MKRGVTFFARAVVWLIALGALAIITVLIPELAREERVENPSSAHLIYPFMIGAIAIATPFFIALYQTLKLLGHIDQNKAFSQDSVRALKNIKYCSAAIAILIVLGAVAAIVLARFVDPREDVTPVVTLGFVFTFASSIVATFAAVLQRLMQDAIAIKKENDSIV